MNLFKDVKNPLPKAIRDPEKLSSFFNKGILYPYFGSTSSSSHGILKILYDLSTLSPSKNSIINHIDRFGFKGKIDLIDRADSGLSLEADSESISDQRKIDLVNRLKEYQFSLSVISKMSSRHVRDECICGNRAVIYEEHTVGDSKKVMVKYVSPRQFLYVVPDKAFDPLEVAVFREEWCHSDELEHKYEVIKVYPEFTESTNVRRTFIHEANLIDRSDLYGRPSDIATLYAQYVEYVSLDHTVKVSSMEVVTKYILAFQDDVSLINDDDCEGDDCGGSQKANDKRANAVRQILTRSDDSKTVAVLGYQGENAPTAIPLEVKRDTEWYKEVRSAMSDYIYSVNGVNKQLVLSPSGGSLGSKSSDVLMNHFKINNIATIKPIQEELSKLWDKVFDLMADFTGIDELSNISVKYPSKIEQLIKELNVNENTADNSGGQEI